MQIMHPPLSEEELGPKLTRLLSPTTPEKIQQGFAKGLAPGFSPDQILLGLYQLKLRGEEWSELTRNTLVHLPDSMYLTAFQTDLPAPVLDYVGCAPIPATALEKLVMLPKTPGETIAYISRACSENLAVIIGDNQARLLSWPPIIESLYMNRNTPMSLAMRIIELAARHKLELSLDAYDEMVKALSMDDLEFDDPMDAEFAAAELDEKFKCASQLEPGADWNPDEEGDDEESENNREVPVILSNLPVSARIRLAQMGNRFQRSQLIRDANKLVAIAVVKSPAITDAEVEEYSKNKQLPEDVIRYISHRKDWVKNYRVKYNLANNPKTPMTTSMALINHLRDNDLRALARSRNVPQAVRQAAAQRLHKKK